MDQPHKDLLVKKCSEFCIFFLELSSEDNGSQAQPIGTCPNWKFFLTTATRTRKGRWKRNSAFPPCRRRWETRDENLRQILRVVPKKIRKTSSPGSPVCSRSQRGSSKWLRCWSGIWKRKTWRRLPWKLSTFFCFNVASTSGLGPNWTWRGSASTPTWKLVTSMKPVTTRRGNSMTLLSGLRPTKSRSWTNWGKGWRASTPQCLPSCSRTRSPSRRQNCLT